MPYLPYEEDSLKQIYDAHQTISEQKEGKQYQQNAKQITKMPTTQIPNKKKYKTRKLEQFISDMTYYLINHRKTNQE